MVRRPWLLLMSAAALLLGPAGRLLPSPRTTTQVPARAAAEDLPGGHAWVGTASCSAAACHGGDGPRGTPRSEYTTWAGHDPHARAYQVLFNQKSRHITRALQRPRPAHQDSLCLNCHVHPDWDAATHQEPFAIADGVGCESCHGPAQKWLSEHYQFSWRTKTAAEKRALGMKDTKSLLGRADACVDCHVGKPGGDVNHDLIAAGHPRLAFEFGAFHAVLPRHWSDRKDRERYPDLEARAWELGQILSAQASLRLLRHRAEGGDGPPAPPWPEFAEYDCAACHHDLKGKSWRQGRGDGKRLAGSPPVNDWYTALLPRATEPAVAEDLKALRDALEKAAPDRRQVATQAWTVLTRLKGRAEKVESRPARSADELREKLLLLVKEGNQAANWDEAAQLYLALAAHHHAWSDLRGPTSRPFPDLRPALTDLSGLLRFPPGYDSPRNFDLDAVRRKLQQFQKLASP